VKFFDGGGNVSLDRGEKFLSQFLGFGPGDGGCETLKKSSVILY